METTIVIMAAGMGSRYGGLKQIDAMGPSGEILMEYAVHDAISAGFSKVVFIIKPGMKEQFHQQIGSRLRSRIEVDYAFQSLEDLPEGYAVPSGREKPWGTSHAILCAADKVSTPFAVFNADDYYGPQAFAKMHEFLSTMDTSAAHPDSAMVGYQIQNTLSQHGSVTRGICRADQGFLKGVREISKIFRAESGEIAFIEGDERGTLEGTELCSMNFWGFGPGVFDLLSDDFTAFLDKRGGEMKSEWLIPTSVDEMIQRGLTRVRVLESTDSWFGVTYPDDKPRVQARLADMAAQGRYPSPLFPGANQ